MEKNKISFENYQKMVALIPQLIEDEKKLFNVLKIIFVDDNNLSDKERVNFSQQLVQTIIDRLIETKNKKYAELLVKIQTQIGNRYNGSILYHFVPRDQKDVKVLMAIPAIKRMIRENQEDNLRLPKSDRIPSLNMPINFSNLNYKACYDCDRAFDIEKER